MKNITATGGGTMKRHGKTFRILDPRVVSREDAAAHVTGAARRVFPKIPFEQAVLLTRA